MTVPCPNCKGKGGSYALVCREDDGGVMWVDCRTCDATGAVTLRREALVLAGRAACESRKARGVGLREEARRLGVSAVALSRWERHGIPLPAARVGAEGEGET